MKWHDRREKFQAVLARDTCIYPVSVFDPMSARMAEEMGFDMAMLAGSVAAITVAAAPDRILITATEFADLAHRICLAGEVPLIVDADHGYGNALNVARTTQLLDQAGIAAMTIEDTALPQPFGPSGASLVSIAEGVGKMTAALAGRVDEQLAIIARTNAIRLGDRAEAIARVQAYSATGVDGIALIGVQTRDELEALCAATELPIMLGGLAVALRDPSYLGGLGVRICLTGHQPFMAAMQAACLAMKAQRDNAEMPPLADSGAVARWTRSDAATALAGLVLEARD